MSQCEKEDVSATVSAPLEESSRDLSSMDEKEREYDKEKDEGEQQNTTAGKAEEVTYPHGFKLAMLTVSIMLAVFIMALDTTVIATAVPKITTNFHSIGDIGWYNNAYLLPLMSLQPTFGKLYSYYNVKYLFLGALCIFELGSLICATAPSSMAFIMGRTVAGIGAAAIYAGGMSIICCAVPLSRISLYLSILSSASAIAAMVGPPLGGIFTDSKRLTWRFCFWINLPFGALAISIFLLVFRPAAKKPDECSLKDKIAKLDLGGTFLFISSTVCLFLSLIWGGNTYPWSDARIWSLIVASVLLMTAFLALQLRSGENATIPPRIFRNRSINFSLLVHGLLNLSVTTHTFYLPFYFQSAKGTTAESSGLQMLPYLLSLTASQLAVGTLASATGIFLPFIWAGSSIFTVAAGLLFTLTRESSVARIIGYQLLAGTGIGAGMQLCATSVRRSVKDKDIPIASTLSVFAPFFGSSLAMSIGQNIFRAMLLHDLARFLPQTEALAIVSQGATAGTRIVPDSEKSFVLGAYQFAVSRVFILPIVAGGLAFLCALGIKWGNLKSGPQDDSKSAMNEDQIPERKNAV